MSRSPLMRQVMLSDRGSSTRSAFHTPSRFVQIVSIDRDRLRECCLDRALVDDSEMTTHHVRKNGGQRILMGLHLYQIDDLIVVSKTTGHTNREVSDD